MKYMFLCLPVALTTFLVISGCMKAGPDFKRPDAGIEMRGSYQHAPAKAAIAVPKDRWWEVFNSRELNELVDEVLKKALPKNLWVKMTSEIISTCAGITWSSPEESIILPSAKKRQHEKVVDICLRL